MLEFPQTADLTFVSTKRVPLFLRDTPFSALSFNNATRTRCRTILRSVHTAGPCSRDGVIKPCCSERVSVVLFNAIREQKIQ